MINIIALIIKCSYVSSITLQILQCTYIGGTLLKSLYGFLIKYIPMNASLYQILYLPTTNNNFVEPDMRLNINLHAQSSL